MIFMSDLFNPDFLNLFNVIIIRYQEIAIKSDKVRKRLIDRLIRNIKSHFQKNEIKDFEITFDWGFIYLKIDKKQYSKVIPILLKIFGIYSISPAIETEIELTQIISTVVQFAKSIIKDHQSFGIKPRKIGQHPFSSQNIAIIAGSEILNQLNPTRSIKVNLDNPDHLIEVVVREKKTYIFNKILPTYWGGNPIDIPRACLSILSGDISEVISSFMVMKRGMYILPLIFNKNAKQIEFLTVILKEILNYLPFNTIYALCINLEPIEALISSLSTFSLSPNNSEILKSILTEHIQLRIAEWIISNQQSLFRYIWEKNDIQPHSNISGIDLKPIQKIELNCISAGNFMDIVNPPIRNIIKKIISSNIPIFQAAISFSNEELIEKLRLIDPICVEVYEKFKCNETFELKNLQISEDISNKMELLVRTIQDKILTQLDPKKIEVLNIS